MKPRREIYEEITEELLRCIGVYHCILPEQVVRLFPGYDAAYVKNVITRLHYKRLIKLDKASGCLMEPLCEGPADKQMIRALWVLVDHGSEGGSHTAGEYPVKLSFVEGGRLYDVVTAAPGEELPVSLALAKRKGEKTPCYIVLNYPEQAEKIDCAGGAVFCMVSPEGKVQYFKKQEGAWNDN